MKRITLSLLGLALVLLAGCVVTSVYPYYTAKDLTFDPTLLGTWSDSADTSTNKETWTFEKIETQTYKLAVREGGKTNEFDAHLFKLGGQTFLDCLPRDRQPYTAPMHVLLRVESLRPRLEMQPLNYEWLAELVKTDPKVIRHVIVPSRVGGGEKDGLLTLTADTAELQKFIRKQLSNPEAWGKPMLMEPL